MEHAMQNNRILVTSDKDFGELAFVRKLQHGVIIRLAEMTIDEQVHAMAEVVQSHGATLTGRLIVTIGRGRARFRRTS